MVSVVKQMITTILLDLDKTLVNILDHVDYCSALRDVKEFLGRHVEADVPETYWGLCASKAMEILVALSGDEKTWSSVSTMIERYEIIGAKNSTPMPGLNTFLQMVEELFRNKAIITLLAEQATNIVLTKHSIKVDVVVARRKDLRPKPFPDQVNYALKALDARPDNAVMLGDSEWDERAAISAGVAFIGLTNGRNVHGFKTKLVVEDLIEAGKVLYKLVNSS